MARYTYYHTLLDLSRDFDRLMLKMLRKTWKSGQAFRMPAPSRFMPSPPAAQAARRLPDFLEKPAAGLV